jgi:sugar/nucleoside kinase (ribokinase family)
MDVIVAGDLFADLILSGFPSWPRHGTEAFATDFHREVGGGAANTACGLAKLGSSASVLGVIGTDGGWLIDRLKSLGVGTAYVFTDFAEPTATAVAINIDRERTFFTYYGANVRFRETLVSFTEFSKASHVHLAWPADLECVEAIRKSGCSLSLDVGWNEDWLDDPGSLELLSSVDIFFPNQCEAERMTHEIEPARILRKFRDAGVRRVVLKLGSEGAAMLWDGDFLQVDPIPVATVDTTGAGDSFDAGFLHFWLRGASPLECLRAANICGALSTESYGGVNGFPDLARVQQELCGK